MIKVENVVMKMEISVGVFSEQTRIEGVSLRSGTISHGRRSVLCKVLLLPRARSPVGRYCTGRPICDESRCCHRRRGRRGRGGGVG